MAEEDRINQDSLSTHVQGLEARIKELESRNKELQATISKSAPKEDAYNDQQIKAKFRALQHAIEDLAKKRFRSKKERTGWSSYDKIEELDERNFFLQAHIAIILAEEYFGDDAQFFSYDSKMDDKLASFEQFLVDRRVPSIEIAEWRTQTVKVAKSASDKINDHQTVVRIVAIPPDLRSDLQRIVPIAKGSPTEHALRAVCASAFDLALCLRSCRSEYKWKQLDAPDSITESDIGRIEDYGVRPLAATGEPAKILFGPLYKRVDNTLVLLRKGTMLCS